MSLLERWACDDLPNPHHRGTLSPCSLLLLHCGNAVSVIILVALTVGVKTCIGLKAISSRKGIIEHTETKGWELLGWPPHSGKAREQC